MEKICNNCQLYDKKNGVCLVVVLHNGEKYELPVQPQDYCHWERVDQEVQRDVEQSGYFKEKDVPIEVKQIRIWQEDGKNFIEY